MTRKFEPNTQWVLIWLRSAVGERKQWSADRVTAGTESERNAAAEPQTEACRSLAANSIAARDERAVCEVERAASRGDGDDGQPVKRSKPFVGHGEESAVRHLSKS
jgi:hypothetical protein